MKLLSSTLLLLTLYSCGRSVDYTIKDLSLTKGQIGNACMFVLANKDISVLVTSTGSRYCIPDRINQVTLNLESK